MLSSGGSASRRDAIDTGTPEFNKRKRVTPIKMRSSVLVRVIDSTAIDRALMTECVTPEQHSVLVAFSNDCFMASLIGPRAQDYGRPMGTGTRHDTSDREAAALQRVGKAIDHIDRGAGRGVREGLLRMILEDLDQPASLVNAAAEVLVDFYSGRTGIRDR